MILKGSQRSGGAQLALHLMKTENEHVALHEVTGFVAEDLAGAFREVYAISRGTRCKQYLFSLSLNPPEMEDVPISVFEEAIASVEQKMGLSGQPRAVVFHEKLGRRHAHCVWSRIDAVQMKAINLPLFKRKLTELSRQIYLEQGWSMPPGLEDYCDRDPLNYSQAEAQQAKRVKRDAAALKALFQQCWAGSDSPTSFANALREQGYKLAKGDRRGFVAVDAAGEVYSLSRWCGVKTKDLRARLGDPASLPNIEAAVAQLAPDFDTPSADTQAQTRAAAQDKIRQGHFEKKRVALAAAQQQERKDLSRVQNQRRINDLTACARRLPSGLKAAWARLTGAHHRICAENAATMQQAAQRDRQKMQALVQRHLKARRALQAELHERQDYHDLPPNAAHQTPHPAPLKPRSDPDHPLIIPPDEDLLSIAEKVARDPSHILDVIADKKEDFTRTDILRALVPYIPDPTKLRLAADAALRAPHLVQVKARPDPRYATEDFLSVKATLTAETQAMRSSLCARVHQPHVEAAIKWQNTVLRHAVGANLSAEQGIAIRHILGTEQLSCVIGLAGAGKSTMLSAARHAWQKQGFPVIGAALSSKAADSLQSASGIESRTLASLEHSWKNGYGLLSRNDVLVIDEAGMVGTRQLARIVSAAKQAGAKLVLVGDPEQLQPIQAGRPFKEIAQEVGAAKLTEIRRQKLEWQRKASRDLAEGRGAEALRAYEDSSCITTVTDTPEAITQLALDYVSDMETYDGPDVACLALAHRRKDVHGINQAIRSLRKSGGNLTVETLFQTEHGPRAFAAGDRLVFTRNDRDLSVKNGSFGTVKAVDDGQIIVTLDSDSADKPRVILVSPEHYSAFDHGYATTIHKSQGATVDKTYVLGSNTMDRHMTYVALTRHRDDMRLYVKPSALRRMEKNRNVEIDATVVRTGRQHRRSGPQR